MNVPTRLELPPLPPISRILEPPVFTHKSVAGLPRAESDPVELTNYERLAFRGAECLRLIVACKLLDDPGPKWRVGPLTVSFLRLCCVFKMHY